MKNIQHSEQDQIQRVDSEIQKALSRLGERRESTVYALMNNSYIEDDNVDAVFDDLCTLTSKPVDKLDVIIHASYGDFHAAYNLALFFRRCVRRELNFIVPRCAKGPATLLACGGDRIYMGPVAELGPIDVHITIYNQGRYEDVSPLSVEATLDLIETAFGRNEKFATALLQRLPPLPSIFSLRKSLKVSKQYMVRLLTTRMLEGGDAEVRAIAIGQTLAESYSDHHFCIDMNEARSMGLKVEELEQDELAMVWEIYRLSKEKDKMKPAKK